MRCSRETCVNTNGGHTRNRSVNWLLASSLMEHTRVHIVMSIPCLSNTRYWYDHTTWCDCFHFSFHIGVNDTQELLSIGIMEYDRTPYVGITRETNGRPFKCGQNVLFKTTTEWSYKHLKGKTFILKRFHNEHEWKIQQNTSLMYKIKRS